MNIRRHITLTNFLIVSSVLYVSLLAGLAVGQTLKNNTHDSSATNTDTSNLKISVQKTIALSNSSPTGIDFSFLGNSGSNESDQKDLTVTVTTNNPTGYTLLMNTISTTTTDNTDLEHELDSSYNIPSTTNPISSPAALELNSWGYSKWGDSQIDAPTTFYTLPTQTTHHTLRTTTDILDTPNTKLTFATYIPNNKPAGEYQKRLLFTATTNYVPVPDITSVTYMQEVTRELCNATVEGVTANLMDQRDGIYYRVKKMVDGNCWMVDNLAYDVGTAAGRPIYSPEIELLPATGGETTRSQAKYIQNSSLASTIPNNGTPIYPYLYSWCAVVADITTNCSASKEALNLQTVVDGTITTTTADETNQPEIIGICPAPFRLPKGGPVANPSNDGTNTAEALASTANEFVKLDIAMGGSGVDRANANTYTSFINMTTDSKDWFGVFNGSYDNGLNSQGSRGDWWSSTAASSGGANRLYLSQSSPYIHPSFSFFRGSASAVRCLL